MINKFFDWFQEKADALDTQAVKFTIYATITVLIGGLVELVPPFFLATSYEPIPQVKPYSALELAGRDTYTKEGCNNCHTQMIRPFKWEVDRFDPQKSYGKNGYSKGGEYVYDHPFLWGSKRTGPDLAHESQIQPSPDWHKRHLINPRETSPGSIMPGYPWLFVESAKIDADSIATHMKGLMSVGVPYTQDDLNSARSQVEGKTYGDALVAYLLKLGRDSAELEKVNR